jgi:hypothetical protein
VKAERKQLTNNSLLKKVLHKEKGKVEKKVDVLTKIGAGGNNNLL